jgi:hypothetical protein
MSYWRQLNSCFTVFPIAKQTITRKGQIECCFAIGNTGKQPFNCLQCDTQTVLVLLLFCFAIGNTVIQPFNCLQYDTQTVLVLLLFFFCYWKYSKATVQLSPM